MSDDLDTLRARVDALKDRAEPKRRTAGEGAGIKIATDLVAGALVGTGVGYYIDKYAGTSPWFTLICFGFGMAAAFRSIFRIMTEPSESDAGPTLENQKKD